MIELLKGIFRRKQYSAGKINLVRGIVVDRAGWTRDSLGLWISNITIREISSGIRRVV